MAGRKRQPHHTYTDDEKASALAVLRDERGDLRRAAARLGIPSRTLYQWSRGRNVGKAVFVEHIQASARAIAAALDELKSKLMVDAIGQSR